MATNWQQILQISILFHVVSHFLKTLAKFRHNFIKIEHTCGHFRFFILQPSNLGPFGFPFKHVRTKKKIIFAEKHEPFEKFIFEIVKKYVHLVDLVKSLPTSIKYLVAKFGFDTPEQFNNQ